MKNPVLVFRTIFRKRIIDSFLVKNMLVYSLIVIIPLVAVTFIISGIVTNLLLQKDARQEKLMFYNLNQYINRKQAIVYTLVKQAYSDIVPIPEVFAFLERDIDETSIEFLTDHKKFFGYFSLFFSADDDLQNVVIHKMLTDKSYLISSVGNRSIDSSDVDKAFLQKALERTPSVSILPAHIPAYRPTARVYSFYINIKMLGTNENSSVLMLDFDPEGFSTALTQMGFDWQQSRIIVLTELGQVLYDSNENGYDAGFLRDFSLDDGNRVVDLNGEKNILSVSRDNALGLKVVRVIPERLVLQEVKSIRTAIFNISILFLLFSVLFIPISVMLFSKRIRIITAAIADIRRGKLDTRIATSERLDEIGVIADSLNHMCDELQQYIDRVYVAEIRQKVAEIGTLQAQINPHFLYNTLEAIRMTALANEDEEVAKMAFLLAGLFRSIIREESIVSIASEMQIARSYMELFKIRYGDRLQFNFILQEDTLPLGICKHLIQPVIENYILHGFDIMKKENRIDITCKMEGRFIRIRIVDNGMGMDGEKLDAIRKDLATRHDEEDHGIGLRNVSERIRLVYGPEYGIEIDSRKNQGTVVTLTIAAKSMEELKHAIQRTDSR